MKKVVLGLLVLGQLGMAKDWYYLNASEREGISECKKENAMNPITAKEYGSEVIKMQDGVYTIAVKKGHGELLFLTCDSLKKCNENRKVLINGLSKKYGLSKK